MILSRPPGAFASGGCFFRRPEGGCGKARKASPKRLQGAAKFSLPDEKRLTDLRPSPTIILLDVVSAARRWTKHKGDLHGEEERKAPKLGPVYRLGGR